MQHGVGLGIWWIQTCECSRSTWWDVHRAELLDPSSTSPERIPLTTASWSICHFPSLVAPDVFFMTTPDATSDDKVGSMTTVAFQRGRRWWHQVLSLCQPAVSRMWTKLASWQFTGPDLEFLCPLIIPNMFCRSYDIAQNVQCDIAALPES